MSLPLHVLETELGLGSMSGGGSASGGVSPSEGGTETKPSRVNSRVSSKANSRVQSRANSIYSVDSDVLLNLGRGAGAGTMAGLALVSCAECQALALVAVPPLLCVAGDTHDIGDSLIHPFTHSPTLSQTLSRLQCKSSLTRTYF